MRSLILTVVAAVQCLAIPISFEQRDASHFLARFSAAEIGGKSKDGAAGTQFVRSETQQFSLTLFWGAVALAASVSAVTR